MQLEELTREIHLENKKPGTRDKAQASLDVVAKAVTLPEKTSKKSMTVRDMATPTEPMLLNRLRYDAGELIASLRSPMQKSIFIRITTLVNTLRIKLHHMRRDTTRDISSTSSTANYIGISGMVKHGRITYRYARHNRNLSVDLVL